MQITYTTAFVPLPEAEARTLPRVAKPAESREPYRDSAAWITGLRPLSHRIAWTLVVLVAVVAAVVLHFL